MSAMDALGLALASGLSMTALQGWLLVSYGRMPAWGEWLLGLIMAGFCAAAVMCALIRRGYRTA